MEDILLEEKKKEVEEKDKQMANEILAFLSEILMLPSDDSLFVEIEKKVSGENPDYSDFLRILATYRSQKELSFAVETMGRRLKNHMQLRKIMLSS